MPFACRKQTMCVCTCTVCMLAWQAARFCLHTACLHYTSGERRQWLPETTCQEDTTRPSMPAQLPAPVMPLLQQIVGCKLVLHQHSAGQRLHAATKKQPLLCTCTACSTQFDVLGCVNKNNDNKNGCNDSNNDDNLPAIQALWSGTTAPLYTQPSVLQNPAQKW